MPVRHKSVTSADRAMIMKHSLGSSVGSYSDSPGIEIIRRHVADYIAKRSVCLFVPHFCRIPYF